MVAERAVYIAGLKFIVIYYVTGDTYYLQHISAFIQILAISLTDSTGYSPLALSPESMTQSDPSMTALATSVTSAPVGFGFLYIESSIYVAVITGLHTMLAFFIIHF